MSDVDSNATYISPLESIVIKDNYINMYFESKKYHVISFRAPVNDLINVTVKGAIEYPGTYTLESESTLEDLYGLVGKFKKEAFLDGVIFTRLSVRERQLESIRQSNQRIPERSTDYQSIWPSHCFRMLLLMTFRPHRA